MSNVKYHRKLDPSKWKIDKDNCGWCIYFNRATFSSGSDIWTYKLRITGFKKYKKFSKDLSKLMKEAKS